jgi:hypothetical protein
MKITGNKAWVFIDNQTNSASDILSTGTTTAGAKYFVLNKAASGSSIPVPAGGFFIAPKTGTQLTLAAGERLFKITEERFCKTSVSFEFSLGSVDVGDDCDPSASIPDGIVSVSGSLAGLFTYNDATQEFDNVTNVIANRFLDIVSDSGNGTYTVSPRSDSQMFLLTLLNSGVGAGGTENWLFVPINITSMSLGLGNADPQGRELSFVKGEGQTAIYKRKVT